MLSITSVLVSGNRLKVGWGDDKNFIYVDGIHNKTFGAPGEEDYVVFRFGRAGNASFGYLDSVVNIRLFYSTADMSITARCSPQNFQSIKNVSVPEVGFSEDESSDSSSSTESSSESGNDENMEGAIGRGNMGGAIGLGLGGGYKNRGRKISRKCY
jgi:hypothetical protein